MLLCWCVVIVDSEQLRVFQRILLENVELNDQLSPRDTQESVQTDDTQRARDLPPLHRRREPDLTQADFDHALGRANFYSADRAIFDRLFILLDRTGEDMVNTQEFLVGMCVLLKGDLAGKLQGSFARSDSVDWSCSTHSGFPIVVLIHTLSLYVAAFEMLCEKPELDTSSRSLTREDLAFAALTMTSVASYFGDPSMTKVTVESIANDVFAPTAASPGEVEDALSASELVARTAEHPLVCQYVQSQGA